jgi:hypothetical protein
MGRGEYILSGQRGRRNIYLALDGDQDIVNAPEFALHPGLYFLPKFDEGWHSVELLS